MRGKGYARQEHTKHEREAGIRRMRIRSMRDNAISSDARACTGGARVVKMQSGNMHIMCQERAN